MVDSENHLDDTGRKVELLFGKAIGYGEFSYVWVALPECHTKEINKEQETIQPLLSWSPVW